MKHFFLFLLLTLSFQSFAQSSAYQLVQDIPYYGEAARQSNSYLAERCVLDVYFPKGSKGFATVIWFHGGGLTAGNKEIPSALQDQGICIVSPNYRLYPKVNAPKYIEDSAAA